MVFLPPPGRSRAERWLAAARSAAAADLVERLKSSGFVPLLALAGDPLDRERLSALGAETLPEAEPPFHFGRALAAIIAARGLARLAYFGGASAPLANADVLGRWLHQAEGLPKGAAMVNNLHSTDWAILSDARPIVDLAERLPTDNPLGWVLREEAGQAVVVPPAATAARTDIDTPGDLALLRGHRDLGPHLRTTLEPFPPALALRSDLLGGVLRTPAASVGLIGRVSESAWRDLVQRAQVWVRVFAEERGMRASGRLERGEVASLVADLVEEQGAESFVGRLGALVQGAFWDTRVWMARRRAWPSAADRMAADLGWVEEIGDPALRTLTAAIAASPTPIVTGGQGIVAGSLRAFVETLFPDRAGDLDGADYQPSR